MRRLSKDDEGMRRWGVGEMKEQRHGDTVIKKQKDKGIRRLGDKEKRNQTRRRGDISNSEYGVRSADCGIGKSQSKEHDKKMRGVTRPFKDWGHCAP